MKKTINVNGRAIEFEVKGIPADEFQELWDMPEDGYPCEGDCGARLSGRGYCAGCCAAAQAKLDAWNDAARATS